MRTLFISSFILMHCLANTVNAQVSAGHVYGTEDTICYGELVNFYTVGSTGSLHWQASETPNNFNDLSFIQEDTIISMFLYATLYFRVYADSGGYSDTSNYVKVLVFPKVSAEIYTYGPDPVVHFEAASLVNDPSSFSYTWYFGEGSPGKGDTITHTYDTCGFYHIRLQVIDTISNCRFSIDTILHITQCSVGVPAVSGNDNITITPNPGNGIFIIHLDNLMIEGKAEVFTLNGQKIIEQHLNAISPNAFDITHYSKGIYFLQVTTNNKVTRQKIIVQ